MVVLTILSPELCPAFQIGGHIAFYMPLRMATTSALLYIAGVSLVPHLPEGLALGLGFFASYQYVKMSHSPEL